MVNEDKKQAIVDKLSYIITHSSTAAVSEAAQSRYYIFGLDNGSNIFLIGAAAKEYEAICGMLKSEKGWRDKFSDDYLEKTSRQIVCNVCKDGNTDKAHQYLDTIIAELNSYAEEHTVYLSIDGIVMKVDELMLGNLKLRNMSGRLLADFSQQVEAGTTQRSADREEKENGDLLKFWHEDVLPILRNKTLAIYTVQAEPTKAQQRAEEAWYQVVRILRYFIFLAYQKRWHIGIGLRGDISYGVGQAVIISSSYEGLYAHDTLKGPRSFIIDQEIMDAMERTGVFTLAEMLEPENTTAFSETLLTGVRWVANALIQDEPANEFLSLVSCLETFLTRDKTDIGSIKNAVAGGVGWVLGRDQDDRIRLHREMKPIYDQRSTVSHGGDQKEIVKLLPKLRDITGAFILAMVERRDEFKGSGKKGLHDWIDEGPMRSVITNQQ